MSEPTFGQQCAAIIFAERTKYNERGITFTKGDLADVIDAHDKARTKPARRSRASNGSPTPFGDRHVIPPTPEQVERYSASIGYPMNGHAWCDSYEQKDWKVGGRARMKDWQAAVRNWKANRWMPDKPVPKQTRGEHDLG